jgi:hypothetical protein
LRGVRKEAYAALKQAITAMDIFDHPNETSPTNGTAFGGARGEPR